MGKMLYNENFWKIFDSKILIDYEKAKEFVYEKKMPFPRFSNMYITSFCNQNCEYCEYGEENKKGGIMPTERVLKNIDEVNELGVKAIDFCGGGEPLLHPRIGKILEHCYKKNIVVGLYTNLAVNNDKLLKIIVNTCSYIRISLDTFDEDTYNLIRKPKSPNFSFSQVEKNLKTLIALKRKHHSNIIIGTKMLISKFNYNQIEDFIKKSIKLNANMVQFKKVSLFDNLYIDKKKENKVMDKLNYLKEKYKKDIEVIFRFYNLKLKCRCFMHFNHIFIDTFGDIYLCCYYLRRKKRHKLGNVYKQKIRDIWFSKKHWSVANNTKILECNQMDCRWIKFNNFMKTYIYNDNLRQLDFV